MKTLERLLKTVFQMENPRNTNFYYKKVIDYLTYNYNLCIKIYYGTDKIKKTH